MAKIETPSYIQGIRGKVCGHENNEYRTNNSSGKIILAKKCNPYQGEPTARQLEVRKNFADRMAVLRTWLKTNRPTKAQPKGTALYQEAERYKKAYKLDNIQAAVCLFQASSAPWTIKLPSETGSSTPSSGGGDAIEG